MSGGLLSNCIKLNESIEWYKEQDAAVYDPQRPEMKTFTNREAPKHYAEAPDRIDDLTAIDRHLTRSGK